MDLVVERDIKNEDTKVEGSKTTMIKGTPVVADPRVPAHIEGNIRDGDMMAEWPLYEVELDGINVVEVRPVFKVLMNMSTLKEKVTELIGKLNPKSYDISSINLKSAWEVRYYDIHKIGRLVIFHARIYAETILALHEYTINTEVDSDLIPLSATPISAIAGDIYMQHTVACKFTLYEDGLIKLEVPDSGKNYIDISCVYMT